MNIELNNKDYNALMTWHDLAFAKEDNSTEQDEDTLAKLLVMFEASLEDQKRRLTS